MVSLKGSHPKLLHTAEDLNDPPPLDGWYCGVDRDELIGSSATTLNIVCPRDNRRKVAEGYWCDYDDPTAYCYCGGNDNLAGRYEKCNTGLYFIPDLLCGVGARCGIGGCAELFR